MSEPHLHALLVAAMVLSAIAAWFDWRKGEIPNGLTLGALALGPLLHMGRYAVAKAPIDAILLEGAISLSGIALGGLVPMLLYKRNAIGGGDVKLLAALGGLLGPVLGVEAQMYGFFGAALLAPVRLAYEGKLLVSLKNAASIGANVFLPKTRQHTIDEASLSWFRLGPALALGVFLTAYLHW